MAKKKIIKSLIRTITIYSLFLYLLQSQTLYFDVDKGSGSVFKDEFYNDANVQYTNCALYVLDKEGKRLRLFIKGPYVYTVINQQVWKPYITDDRYSFSKDGVYLYLQGGIRKKIPQSISYVTAESSTKKFSSKLTYKTNELLLINNELFKFLYQNSLNKSVFIDLITNCFDESIYKLNEYYIKAISDELGKNKYFSDLEQLYKNILSGKANQSKETISNVYSLYTVLSFYNTECNQLYENQYSSKLNPIQKENAEKKYSDFLEQGKRKLLAFLSYQNFSDTVNFKELDEDSELKQDARNRVLPQAKKMAADLILTEQPFLLQNKELYDEAINQLSGRLLISYFGNKFSDDDFRTSYNMICNSSHEKITVKLLDMKKDFVGSHNYGTIFKIKGKVVNFSFNFDDLSIEVITKEIEIVK